MGQFVFSLIWLEMGFGRALVTSDIKTSTLRYVEYAENTELAAQFDEAPNELPIAAMELATEEDIESTSPKENQSEFRPVIHSKKQLYLSTPMENTEFVEIGDVHQVETDFEAELFLKRSIELVGNESAFSSKRVTLFSLDDQICEATLDEPFAIVRAIAYHSEDIKVDETWAEMANAKSLAWTLRFEDEHCRDAAWGRMSDSQSAPRTSKLEEVFVGEKNRIVSAIAETAEYQTIQKRFELETHAYNQWHEEPATWTSVKKLDADHTLFFFNIEAAGCGEFGGALSGIWDSKTNQATFFDDGYQNLDLVRAVDLNDDGSWKWIGASRHNELLLFQKTAEEEIKELESSPLPSFHCQC